MLLYSSFAAKKKNTPQGHQAFALCSACKIKAEIPHPYLNLDILLLLVERVFHVFFKGFVNKQG